MKYIKYFESIEESDISEIKDLFQEYADEWNLSLFMGYGFEAQSHLERGEYYICGVDGTRTHYFTRKISSVEQNPSLPNIAIDYITIIAYPYIKTGVGWNVSITKFANSMSKFKDRVQSVGYECECRWFGNTYKIIITSR